MSILLWIGIPVALIIIGVMLVLTNKFYDWRGLFIAGGSIVLAITLLAWLICYTDTLGDIKEFESVKNTVTSVRSNENISEYEKAALSHKIVDTNKWLATTQYWGSMWALDMFYPDRIHDLKPIR